MKPIITKCPTVKDDIGIEIRQFKTVYIFDETRHEGLAWLSRLGFHPSTRLKVTRIERDTLRRHYAAAMRPRTINSLLVELSDRGVETTRLQIPCIGEGCKEVAIEEVTAPMRLDVVASEAEYACEFTDGLCPSCHRQARHEEAEENEARDRHEAREEQCHE
jgi:hypothetical protein